MDFQPLYPRALVPAPLRAFVAWYLDMSGDPLLKSAFGQGEPLVWFSGFLFLELYVPLVRLRRGNSYWGRCSSAFQFPTFFIAARGLWNGAFYHSCLNETERN